MWVDQGLDGRQVVESPSDAREALRRAAVEAAKVRPGDPPGTHQGSTRAVVVTGDLNQVVSG